MDPTLTLECRPSEEPWTTEAGGRAVLQPGRNYFIRKPAAPFYTAAAVEEQGRAYWVFAMVDGRTQILDANFEVAGAVAGWGSDLAGARCGTGTQILATKPGTETDSLRAYALVNRAPVTLTSPLDFAGPITALWSAGGPSVIAVVRDPDTNRYAVYLVTVVCGG
jgi:hypothetical protein